jgi:hypothetical protein
MNAMRMRTRAQAAQTYQQLHVGLETHGRNMDATSSICVLEAVKLQREAPVTEHRSRQARGKNRCLQSSTCVPCLPPSLHIACH